MCLDERFWYFDANCFLLISNFFLNILITFLKIFISSNKKIFMTISASPSYYYYLWLFYETVIKPRLATCLIMSITASPILILDRGSESYTLYDITENFVSCELSFKLSTTDQCEVRHKWLSIDRVEYWGNWRSLLRYCDHHFPKVWKSTRCDYIIQ